MTRRYTGSPGSKAAKKGGANLAILPGGKSSKYDEAEFLVGGRGTGPGDTHKESFRIHEGYVAEALRWLHSGLFPYDSLTDLYRHAVVRHLRDYLPSLEGEVEGSTLHELKQIDEIVSRQEFHLRFISSIESIAKILRDVIHMPGGDQEIGRMLRQMKRHIAKMRPSFWKSYYETLFDREFKSYIAQGLVLMDFADDDSDDVADSELLKQFPGVFGGYEPRHPELYSSDDPDPIYEDDPIFDRDDNDQE